MRQARQTGAFGKIPLKKSRSDGRLFEINHLTGETALNCNHTLSDIKEFLVEEASQYPVCEYMFGAAADVPFSDKVLHICENECTRYGKCWACPPYAGGINDNIELIRSYKHFFLFSTVWEVAAAWDAVACLNVKKEHEAVTRSMRADLFEKYGLPLESHDENPHPAIYTLSSGCTICDVCSCPDEPCKHPKERLQTSESHGITIMELIEKLGMTYDFGGNTVVYFSMFFFN